MNYDSSIAHEAFDSLNAKKAMKRHAHGRDQT